jgi:ankyrin repeat protein
MAGVTGADAAVVQALLGKGADFRVADAGGVVAMTYAAAAGATDAIEALLKRGAKPSGRDLMAAATDCHAPALRLLLASGLKPNEAVDGKAPLLAAASERCVDAVTVLLDKGADVNVKDSDGRTALIVAAAGGMLDVARVLLERGADMDIVDGLDRSAWMYASMANREEMAALFKEAKSKK